MSDSCRKYTAPARRLMAQTAGSPDDTACAGMNPRWLRPRFAQTDMTVEPAFAHTRKYSHRGGLRKSRISGNSGSSPWSPWSYSPTSISFRPPTYRPLANCRFAPAAPRYPVPHRASRGRADRSAAGGCTPQIIITAATVHSHTRSFLMS